MIEFCRVRVEKAQEAWLKPRAKPLDSASTASWIRGSDNHAQCRFFAVMSGFKAIVLGEQSRWQWLPVAPKYCESFASQGLHA